MNSEYNGLSIYSDWSITNTGTRTPTNLPCHVPLQRDREKERTRTMQQVDEKDIIGVKRYL